MIQTTPQLKCVAAYGTRTDAGGFGYSPIAYRSRWLT
jgi:hypothetical protein